MIDRLAAAAASCGAAMGVEVFAAREGLVVDLAAELTSRWSPASPAVLLGAVFVAGRRGEAGRRLDMDRPGPADGRAARRWQPSCRGVELLLGAALITGLCMPVPALAAIGLLVVFSVTIARQLVDGRHPPCACFGAWSTPPAR